MHIKVYVCALRIVRKNGLCMTCVTNNVVQIQRMKVKILAHTILFLILALFLLTDSIAARTASSMACASSISLNSFGCDWINCLSSFVNNDFNWIYIHLCLIKKSQTIMNQIKQVPAHINTKNKKKKKEKKCNKKGL